MSDVVVSAGARGFSTASAPRGREVELWERYNAEALVALSCQAPDDRTFDALEVNLDLDEVHLARVRGTRHAVERSAALAADLPTDAVAVYVAVRGESVFEQDGERLDLWPGQLVVCDADRPFARRFGRGLDELVVTVARSALARCAGPSRLAAPRVSDIGPGGDPHGRALARLVGRALRPDAPVPPEEAAVLELVALLASGGRAGSSVAHRAAARAYVEEHLTDQRLSAAEIAAATGISDRHLSRLFADAGTSVPRHILARRLDVARSLLDGPGAAGLRTADVARRCGFTSAPYFSQTFHARFGVTAGEVRRLAAHRFGTREPATRVSDGSGVGADVGGVAGRRRHLDVHVGEPRQP